MSPILKQNETIATRSSATEMHRREFLSSCGALLVALSGLPLPSLLEPSDEHPDDFEPVLCAVIETILPFDHPRFPRVSAPEIQTNLLALFPLGDESYAAVRKALLVFDDLDLFPLLHPPLGAEERAHYGATNADVAAHARWDERRFAEFQGAASSSHAPRFTALEPPQRANYLRLWGQSAFNSKQRFYYSLKSLVMVTAYSRADLWHAIEYAGPLLERGR
jgi:hypothetical protein